MKLSAAPGHKSRAGGSGLHQNHKVQWASGDSMMCFKKCLYGTLQDGVQKGEGRLARREAPLLEKAGWAGLITGWALGTVAGTLITWVHHPPRAGSCQSPEHGQQGQRA